MKTKRDIYSIALAKAGRSKPNWSEILTLLEQAAERGDARAIYALGTWYLHGRHVEQNVRTGVKLIKQAADAGVSDALYDLAVSYECGAGVRKNVKRAAELYLNAALSGDFEAWRSIGRCFYHGIGVAKDRRIAWILLDHHQQGSASVKKSKRKADSPKALEVKA